MADLTDAEFEAAGQRGEIVMRTRPRAVSACYDRAQSRIVVDLANGATFAFPPRLLEGFAQAGEDDIAAVEVQGVGFGLHWEALDADFTVEGLMAGRFGTTRYMVERFGPAWDAAAA